MRSFINRLNPLDMALLLGLFEGAALFALAIFGPLINVSNMFLEDVLLGASVGVASTVIALMLWKLRPVLRGELNNKKVVIAMIQIATAAIANAAFLSVLFITEDFIYALKGVPLFGVALFGLVGTGLSVGLLLVIYNLQPLKVKMNIGSVMKMSPFKTGLMAGVYEAFILPVMVYGMSFSGQTALVFTIAGLISGLFGGFLGTCVLNLLAPKLKPWIELEK